MPGTMVLATQKGREDMTGKNYYLPGLQKGWELARQKKLAPKPCLICGKDVWYKKSTKERAKYCSLKCKNKGLTGRKYIRRKAKSGIVLICKTCRKEFYRAPSELVKGKSNYCCFACRKKGNYNPYRKGKEAPNWKGGRSNIGGYIYIYAPDHPRANCQNQVAEHRLVMEKVIGRYLLSSEKVHHINGIKADNQPKNLRLVSPFNHTIYNELCSKCELRKEIRLMRWQIQELTKQLQFKLEEK